MITTIVKFRLPPGVSRQQWLQNSKEMAPRFQSVPGLIRKNFLFSSDGWAGGVYTWESREAAERCHAGVWRDNLRKLYGAEPEITYFDSPVIVDNASKHIDLSE